MSMTKTLADLWLGAFCAATLVVSFFGACWAVAITALAIATVSAAIGAVAIAISRRRA